MQCDLAKHFREMAAVLQVSETEKYRFSSESFANMPGHLETDRLAITKEHKDYNGTFRVDLLRFFAQKTTYRELALLILSVIFRPGGSHVHVTLTSPASTVKNLVIEYEGFTKRGFEYRTHPDHFLFFPGKVNKHPWLHQNVELFGLPTFRLTNLKEFVLTEEDWARRDTVQGFGNDDASVRLAELLLRFGSPENEANEVVLEGEGGFRGVGRFSAEAGFYLPGSQAWPPSMPF